MNLRPTTQRSRARGQSVVELALVLPVILLLLFTAIDFGRVFLGWIELNNVAREAANFAAENPTAWNSVNPDATAEAQYESLVSGDAAGIDCTLPSPNPAPVPSFPSGPNGQYVAGDTVSVSLTCSFPILTPIVSSILPNPLPVSAAAAFPIQFAALPGIPTPPPPTPTPAPSPTPTPTPAPTPTPTPGPTPTPTPTPVPTPTPTPMCTVPDFSAGSGKASNAPGLWSGAGFTSTVLFSPLNPGKNARVTGQSQLAGQSLPCGSTAVTVTWQ